MDATDCAASVVLEQNKNGELHFVQIPNNQEPVCLKNLEIENPKLNFFKVKFIARDTLCHT